MATSNKLRRPCCGYYILDEGPRDYDICPICYREDDLMQRNKVIMHIAEKMAYMLSL